MEGWSLAASLALVGSILVAIFWWRCSLKQSGAKSLQYPSAEEDSSSPTLHRLRKRLLQALVTLKEQLQEHRGNLQDIKSQLSEMDTPPVTSETVVAALVTLAETNQRLQDRLVAAESRLAQQFQELQAQWEEVRSDPLTGLPNRRLFDQELRRRIHEFWKTTRSFALAIFDVDHFKQINDTYGHKVGDEVLIRVAESLRKAAPPQALLARIGGEEFAMIWPHEQLSRTLDEVETVRRATLSPGCQVLPDRLIALSCGVAVFTHADDENRIFERADQALYAAKEAGRNATFYHDGIAATRWPATGGVQPALNGAANDEQEETILWDRDPEAQSLVQVLRSKLAEFGLGR